LYIFFSVASYFHISLTSCYFWLYTCSTFHFIRFFFSFYVGHIFYSNNRGFSRQSSREANLYALWADPLGDTSI
jgi:hypothetical protein